MVATTVSQSTLPYFLLSLLGSDYSSGFNNDRVHVNVNGDNFDGSVTIPRWALAQATGASLGYIPANSWSYDDDTLPSSIKMDSDWYEIGINLSSFDQDRVRVKVLDSQTIRVEAKRKYVTIYGATTSRTVSRRFPVPRTYDVYKMDAKTDRFGILTLSIPSKNGHVVSISRNDGYVRIDY